MLFADFSFTDKNFFRMAHARRQALVDAGNPRTMGTALELRRDPVRQSLWEGELNYLSMGGPDTATAARRLEIFLDRVVQLTTDDVPFLLDPAYDSLKSVTDRRLANELLGSPSGWRVRAQLARPSTRCCGRWDGGGPDRGSPDGSRGVSG